MTEQISFFAADIKLTLSKRTEIRKWITTVIRKEGYTLSSLNYIFCSDAYLLDMNIRHLKHKTLTDIITFDLSSEKKVIEGEIYISIERVKENATVYKVPKSYELHRVMVHGVLHLCGYKDKKPAEQKKIREMEDFYLKKLH